MIPVPEIFHSLQPYQGTASEGQLRHRLWNQRRQERFGQYLKKAKDMREGKEKMSVDKAKRQVKQHLRLIVTCSSKT